MKRKSLILTLALLIVISVVSYSSAWCPPNIPKIDAENNQCSFYDANGVIHSFGGVAINFTINKDQTGNVTAQCLVYKEATTLYPNVALPLTGSLIFLGPTYPGFVPNAILPGTQCCIAIEDGNNVTGLTTGFWKEELAASGQVDLWCIAAGCTLTQGYWKTHNPLACDFDLTVTKKHKKHKKIRKTQKTGYINGYNESPLCIQWPVTSLTLGTVSYTVPQLVSIFNTSVGGNGLISLAHQLIAAKLNIANGADGSAITSTIAAADALINGLIIPPVGSGYLDPSAVSALVTALDNFNSGLTGPGHCEDSRDDKDCEDGKESNYLKSPKNRKNH